MKKDKKKIWIWAAVIGIIILIMQPGGIVKTQENIQSLISKLTGGTSFQGNANLGNPEKDFISLKLYDKNGNEIKMPESDAFSVISIGEASVSGVYYLAYTVGMTNNGTRDLSCTLSTVSPATPFDCTGIGCSISNGASISKTTYPVTSGKRATWTSNLIPTSQMEILSQPITLDATVSCVWYDGVIQLGPITRRGKFTFSVTSTAAGTVDFTVNVSTGGIPTEFCGDTICQSPFESDTSCSTDCAMQTKIKFRTSDLFYPSGSAIAYSNTCNGNAITRYGYINNSIGCWQTITTDSTCQSNVPGFTLITTTNMNPVLTGKVGSVGRNGYPSWANALGCLYQNSTNANEMIMAFRVTDTTKSGVPCNTVGKWGIIRYNSLSPYINRVDSNGYGFDSDKEVIC